MGDTGGTLFLGALIVGFVIVMFLVLREVVCWYWKINRGIELLTEIRDLLKVRGTA